jgi:acyl carrier protein
MMPSAFVFLETLPLSATGKIDPRALPAPSHARPALNVPYVAPRTPSELDLARVWAEVLEVEQVGIDDPFLELGGDSLQAARILARIVGVFGVELPIELLFGNATTVAGIALAIEVARSVSVSVGGE